MKVDVYTDGACNHNGKKNAQASYAYYFPDHKALSFAARVPDDQPQTNNRGELTGILEAVKKAQTSFPAEEIELHIYTDSEYSKNCLTKWLTGWIAKGWKTSTGTNVINRDLIENISGRFLMFQSYTITHVRAHTGGDDEQSRNNHIVDRMAARVLNPEEEVKIINVPSVGCSSVKGPLQVMGPAVTETELFSWCMENLKELDDSALKSAILTAYTKTMKKNGYDVIKQKLHRTTEYRLNNTNLTIEKEEA